MRKTRRGKIGGRKRPQNDPDRRQSSIHHLFGFVKLRFGARRTPGRVVAVIAMKWTDDYENGRNSSAVFRG
ncbi:hypothetical protein NC652_032890 [Populus alba x Populus x berolinensis]|nr:hypothetical protein NC652_032890 [Populus alba x Populus x berolinensis]